MSFSTAAASFAINNLGEVFVYGACVQSSINLSALRHKLKLRRAPNREECDAEFTRLARAHLDSKQFRAYQRHCRLMNIGDSLVRFYTADRGGKVVHFLSVEFVALADAKPIWRHVYELASVFDAEVEDLWKAKNGDKTGHQDSSGRIRWKKGPNYGHIERQVALYVDVTNKQLAQVRELRDSVLDSTKKLDLEQALVAVI